MPGTIPKFVEHFPTHRDRVLRAQFRDAVINDLCRDYDRVAEALDQEEVRRRRGTGSEENYRELAVLCRDLEREIFSRLAIQTNDHSVQ